MKCANTECGKEFSNFIGDQFYPTKKYCSEKCRNKVKVGIRNIREKQKRHSNKVNLTCVKCGVSISSFRKYQKYCSKKCRENTWNKNNREQSNRNKIKWATLNHDKVKNNRNNYISSGKNKAFKKRYTESLMDGYVNQLLKVVKHEYISSLIIPEELIELKRIHLKGTRTIKQLTK